MPEGDAGLPPQGPPEGEEPGRRAGPTDPGALAAQIDAWIEATRRRLAGDLRFRELRRGVQAVSYHYVEAREAPRLGARVLGGRARRAAFSCYFAPLHFLACHHLAAPRLLGALRAGELSPPARIVDAGCGTGASGAGLASALPAPRPRILGLDRSGFALGEARHTWAAFGLRGTAIRGEIPRSLPRPRAGDLWLLAYVTNELGDTEREALVGRLRALQRAGGAALVVEPLARPVAPWWGDLDRALPGSRSGVERARIPLPDLVARLDRAAGLDHATLGARVLLVPPEGRPRKAPTPVRTPRASVLLPVRDAAGTLGAALATVARQSERDFECVVVDDGSRDGSAECAEAVARRDPRFHVLRLPRRGLVHALLEGLGRCRAPVVVRMDADDLMHRERIRLQLGFLDAHPGLAGVGCGVRIFPRRGLAPGRLRYEAWLNALDTPEAVLRDAFVECPVAHPALALRREVLDRHPWREGPWPEDYDLVLRILRAGARLANLPRRLHLWRDHPGRLSRTDPRYGPDRFTALRAHHLAAGFLADRPDYVLWGYGATGRALRRALAREAREPSHIVEVHPRRLGQRIHGAPVVPPAELARLRGRKVVASVAGPAARAEIRAHLVSLGFRELEDFVCAA